MSLSTNDLSEIRNIIEPAIARLSEEVIPPLQSEIEAFRNDIEEIYDMLAGVEESAKSSTGFAKLSLEKKIIKLHSELLAAAKQAGVTLPSH